MNILVTGASGFIGRTLVESLREAPDCRVYALYRQPPDQDVFAALHGKVVYARGDILADNLGIDDPVPHFDRVYHIAGMVNLGGDKDGVVWRTNVEGTAQVVKFCARHDVPHLLFCSTAYTMGRNPYERSKRAAEVLIAESDIPRRTIFKPSIVLGTERCPYYGHFSQFARLLVRMHRRAEIIRRGVESWLFLPLLRPKFRVVGNAEGFLNLVKVDDVVAKMASVTAPGTYWLTNPRPPRLGTLLKWIGEAAKVDAVFEEKFQPTLIERRFNREVKAFLPYLQGDNLPSDIARCDLTEEFLRWTIQNQLDGGIGEAKGVKIEGK